jgi:hypothetical protein
MSEERLTGFEDRDELKTFCLLLWVENGGLVDQHGVPYLDPHEVDYVRGSCTRASDCERCAVMARELVRHPEGSYAWLCPECAAVVATRAKERRIKGVLPGHYTEGWCQNPGCWMFSRLSEPRYSIFLQLALGPISQLLGDEG